MRTNISSKFKPQLYTSFAGINTSRSDVSMERPEAQPFIEMDNLYCTSNGYLANEPPMATYTGEKAYISHFRFVDATNKIGLYAAQDAGGMSIRVTGRVAALDKVWSRGTVISTTMFNGSVIIAGGQPDIYSFDGFEFKKITSKSVARGRYVAQIQNRLAVAGFDDNPNEVQLSKVENQFVFKDDEADNEASVLKAARFNIRNMIGNSDRIHGITSFEHNKFAIFTGSRVLIYIADPDFDNWQLDTRLVVRYGAISHNSIISVGDEVFFCSRAGIHSIRRSAYNGVTVYTTPLSDDIQELYQRLVARVANPEDISGYFNTEDGRMHFFFPVNNLVSYRLSGSLSPAKQEGQPTTIRWSLSQHGGLTCGDYLDGVNVCGSISGLSKIEPWYSDKPGRSNGYAETPILWHKDLFKVKTSLYLVLYASGAGKVFVDASDETGRALQTVEFDLPDDDQVDFTGVPLQRQFLRPLGAEYIGVRMRLRFEATKMIRVFGVGILTKE